MDAALDMNARPDDADYYQPVGPAVPSQALQPLNAETPINRTSHVSLIIPTYLNDELKSGSLRPLLMDVQRAVCVTEVIVIAADGEPGRYRSLESVVHPIPFRVERGPANNRAAARNIGAALATGNHLLFIDDDMLVRDWRAIDAILSATIESETEFAMFPRREYLRFPTLFSEPATSRSIARWRSGILQSDVADSVQAGDRYKTSRFCFPGCFMLADRSAFKHMGGFSEQYEGWGLEDAHFALVATTTRRVLNLFGRAEPLLHIDHPVSPYKSDEHRCNYARFAEVYSSLELDSLCDRVFTGVDWPSNGLAPGGLAAAMEPLYEACRCLSLRLDWRVVEPHYARLVEDRVSQGHAQSPKYVVLFGSRARSEACDTSDFDLLVLFEGGRTRDCVVSRVDGCRVDLEYADIARFTRIAARPSAWPWTAPLEMAKLLDGVLLFGPENEWMLWRRGLIERAVTRGRVLWLLIALNMALEPSKQAGVGSLFCKAARRVCVATGSVFPDDEPQSPGALPLFVEAATRALDASFPEWVDQTQRGTAIYPEQSHDIWNALLWLSERSVSKLSL